MPLFNRPLPGPLSVLRELALDLHWSWYHDSDQLWQLINEEVWQATGNPISVLQLTPNERLEELASDPAFVRQLDNLVKARQTYLTEPSWYQRQYPDSPIPGIAYLSMEFGLCDALPIYAGGLGMLAGDYMKTASDLGVPLIGVGLLYQEGYFHQSLDRHGWQTETYLFNDPGSLPIQPLRAPDGSWQNIDTEFLGRRLRLRVWQVQVGRVTLYLLDSNDPRNRACDREITSKLYGGNTELRLVQEIALGICGWRLVETLGLGHYVCHLNEGHAAFATLERIRCYRQANGGSYEQALWATRAGNLFTTHTPVAAGFDRYPADLLSLYIGEFAQHLELSTNQLLALGRANPKDHTEDFNMAYLAMRTCAFSNGVSQLHGQVSRSIFQPLYPRWPERDVPVGHVTNGVHVPTWDSPRADREWQHLFGPDLWRTELSDTSTPLLEKLEDQRLWSMLVECRTKLVTYARARKAEQWRMEAGLQESSQVFEQPLDPNVLTMGFARRFAEYKRPLLLLKDPERLVRLLNHPRRPLQLIIAGKAHPADKQGKAALQAWHRFSLRPEVRNRLVILEDYDIELAQQLVQGVDLWLNTPRRPWEASGTSGMKTLVNGGLNLSSLDGWWAEAYSPELGWAIGDGETQATDAEDAEQLYRLLEEEIAPLFYQRDNDQMPKAWLARVRASMAHLTARFSCNRMMCEYLQQYYQPAAEALNVRLGNQGQLAKDLEQWQQQLNHHWGELRIGECSFSESETHRKVQVQVYLGSINPEAVRVQLIADSNADHKAVALDLEFSGPEESAVDTYRYQGFISGERPDSEYTARVTGRHSNAQIPMENPLIIWQSRY